MNMQQIMAAVNGRRAAKAQLVPVDEASELAAVTAQLAAAQAQIARLGDELATASTERRTAVQAAVKLELQVGQLERELKAERAENARLLRAGAAADLRSVVSDDTASWKRRAELDRAALVRQEDRIRQLEGLLEDLDREAYAAARAAATSAEAVR